MATGIVKWFSTDKGYGFIKPNDGGNDVFVHITALEQARLKASDLKEGTEVTFELSQERGKTSATDLKLS